LRSYGRPIFLIKVCEPELTNSSLTNAPRGQGKAGKGPSGGEKYSHYLKNVIKTKKGTFC